jgi:hypothetical protein
VLDDIDKARATDYAAEQLWGGINLRVSEGKPLLITSNLRLAALRDRYSNGHSLVSRIGGFAGSGG